MVLLGVILLIVIAVGVGVSRKSAPGTPIPTGPESSSKMVAPDTGRFLIYGVAFIGLMGFLVAVVGLLGILLAETVFSSHALMSASDAREQISYYLAGIIVGTPLWLGFSRAAERRISTAPEERGAADRRLFFAATFAVTSVVALFALHTLLRVLFTLPGPHDTADALRDGVKAAIQLLVFGGAWSVYTRLAWRERSPSEVDPARDLAMYVLSGFALVFTAIGVANALAVVMDAVLHLHQEVLLGSSTGSLVTLWGGNLAWIISGGLVWAAISSVDATYYGVRSFRVQYLYIALAVSVGFTLATGTDLAYELLRRLFGYRTGEMWNFLHDVVPPLLVAGTIWAYHWTVLRRQATLAGQETPDGYIAWPRRPYFAALSFVGLVMTAAGAVALLWLIPDFLFKSHSTVSDSGWWRDQLSLGMVILGVGAVVWLRPWTLLQRAAMMDTKERGGETRRWLLGAIALIGTLVGVGFAIAFLWLVFRMVLGGPHDSSTVSDIFKYLATTLVVAGIATYHAQILRGDLRSSVGRTARLRMTALLAPGGRESLTSLSKEIGGRIDVAGYLTTGDPQGSLPMSALLQQLEVFSSSGATRVVLILGKDGGIAYPYTRGNHQIATDTARDTAVPVTPSTGAQA